jgi:hypothetical protein
MIVSKAVPSTARKRSKAGASFGKEKKQGSEAEVPLNSAVPEAGSSFQ